MKRYFLTFVLSLVALIVVNAQEDKTSLKDKILYVNISNPLLFGKAGLAFSIRNERMDYFVYSNYRFSPGVMASSLYYYNGQYGKASPSDIKGQLSGFDIGVQFRFRDPLLKKPYAKYLKNVENASPFYFGFLVECSYISSVRETVFIDVESDVLEPSAGFLVGYTLSKGNVVFDIHMALALGASIIEYDVTRGYFQDEIGSGSTVTGLIRYDLGFLIGYKF